MCRAQEAELIRLGQPLPRDHSIRTVETMEPFINALSREISAFLTLAEHPVHYGFYASAPTLIELGNAGADCTSSSSSANLEQLLTRRSEH